MKIYHISALLAIITLLQSCIHPDTPGVASLDTFDITNFIPVDSAEKMQSSYVGSLSDTPQNLHEIYFSADDLRAYLANPSITEVKVILAHTLEYINSGHENQPAGYRSGALTFVVAGVDSMGDNVYFQNDRLLNRGKPCPPICSFETPSL